MYNQNNNNANQQGDQQTQAPTEQNLNELRQLLIDIAEPNALFTRAYQVNRQLSYLASATRIRYAQLQRIVEAYRNALTTMPQETRALFSQGQIHRRERQLPPGIRVDQLGQQIPEFLQLANEL